MGWLILGVRCQCFCVCVRRVRGWQSPFVWRCVDCPHANPKIQHRDHLATAAPGGRRVRGVRSRQGNARTHASRSAIFGLLFIISSVTERIHTQKQTHSSCMHAHTRTHTHEPYLLQQIGDLVELGRHDDDSGGYWRLVGWDALAKTKNCWAAGGPKLNARCNLPAMSHQNKNARTHTHTEKRESGGL